MTALGNTLKRILRTIRPSKQVYFDGLSITGAIEDYGFLAALARGEREPYMVELFKAHLKPGDLFIDVGAHLGQFSLLAARNVGPTGHVMAFEPHPRTSQYLKANIMANNLSSTVTTYDCLLSSACEEVSFYANEFQSDCATMVPSPNSSVGIKLKTMPLDQLVREQLPRVVKIDVEGAELKVLAGMQQTLKRIQDAKQPFTLFIECNAKALQMAGASAAQLIAALKSFGLNVKCIDEAHKRCIDQFIVDNAAVENLLCQFH